MNQTENKVLLRRAMQAVLANLDQRWVKAASGRVCDNLVKHIRGFPRIDHVLAWSSFFAGEVDLSAFVGEQLGAGRRVYLPQTRSDKTMQFISINEGWAAEAVAGVGGVPEPCDQSGHLFDAHDAANAIVLVPGLAFDVRGGRLGRGSGFYDRFLARSLMRTAQVLGVGWELQLVPEVPMSGHDQQIEKLITEQRMRDFVDAPGLTS